MLENDPSPLDADNTVYLKDYQTPSYKVSHVDLDFRLGKEATIVTAELEVVRNGQHSEPLILNGEKIMLLDIRINDEALSDNDYRVTTEVLVIDSVPDRFSLQIKTQLQPHLNTELSGLYRSSGNFCTQCEAQGFRRITYFPDRPDVLACYDVTITADKASCPVLLCNGNLSGEGDNEDGTHWARWSDPHPKPSYLFALVAGDLASITDSFTTASGENVELNIYTQAHNIDKCDHAMQALKHSMCWDERVYGREYDLSIYNIVAVDDFNMGAMENKGLNIFNSKYVLANQQTATDSDFEGIESVIAHEYFHNWSGNRVTCRDWFQLSLKEGFTVFRDQEFSADRGSRAVKRIRDVQMLRAYQFKEDSGPMAHPVRPESYQEINNFYTVTIYEKGAEVIRMIHAMLGVDGFRRGTDLYFEKFDGQAVTTEDFVQCMEQVNGCDLRQFRLWYTQSGTPEVDAQQRFENGRLHLLFKQHCPATPGQVTKDAFQIPIVIALFSGDGEKKVEETLLINQEHQQFEFDGFENKPLVSMLRDFSAPIKLKFQQSDDELAQLIKLDDNGFARWEAMQTLTLNLLLPAIASGELDETRYQKLVQALRELLKSSSDDKAILAEMLKLPSLAYIAELSKPIDPPAIDSTRAILFKRLSHDLELELLKVYQKNDVVEGFSLAAQSMAQRALKNTVLKYLIATEKPEYYTLAREQYNNASNMTDRLAAFTGLLHSEYPDRVELLGEFYQAWKSEPLVLDKWFAIQATSPSNDVLDQVIALTEHPAFSISNPNKVRSLLGALAGNMSGFHRDDGSAYEFLANRVIELDQINPQVAARLAGAFNGWKSFNEPYSALMRVALERIGTEQSLTKDVREIVNKALQN